MCCWAEMGTMSFAARIDQAAGQSLYYDNFIWYRSPQPAMTSLSGGDDYLDGGPVTICWSAMAGMTFSLAEPVMIGYMASRILLRRSPATIGLKGGETIRCLEAPEQTGSPEVTEMTS